MLKAKKMLDDINFGLSTLQSFIATYTKLNFSDTNIAAEDLVADMLNAIFGWSLVNANKIKPNHECIDLFDPDSRVGVQVTSKKGAAKINETLACITCHDLNLTRLIVFTLSPRQKSYAIKPSALDFNHKNDVIDFCRIVIEARHASFKALSDLHSKIKRSMPFLTDAFSGALDAEILNGYVTFGEEGDGASPLRQEVIQLVKDKKTDLAKKKLDECAQFVLKEAGGKLYSLANLYTLVDPLKAELFYQKAAVMQPEGVASANLHGLNLMKLGQLDEAERTFKLCLDSPGLTQVQREHLNGNLGILAKKRSRYPEAVEYFRIALKLTGESDTEGFANHYNNLGSCYNHLEKYGRAGRCLKVARAFIDKAIEFEDDLDERKRLMVKKSNLLTNTAIQLRYLAVKRREPKLLDEAKSLLFDAISIAEMSQEKTELTRHYGNLSNVYKDMGKYDLAEKYLSRSYNAAIGNDDHLGEFTNLVNLGHLMIKTSELGKAEKYLDEALVKEGNRYPKLRAEVFGYFAMLYKAQGHLLLSKENFDLAAGIYQDLELPDRLRSLVDELNEILFEPANAEPADLHQN